MEHTKLLHGPLNKISEGVQLIGLNWEYLYINEAAANHGKRKRDEYFGKTMMQMYPGITETAMFKTLEQCHQLHVSADFENQFVFPDGTSGWFELRVEPVEDGLFILSFDITEKKAAEEKNKSYTKAIEELLFMTSHQLRQPIAQIIGLSDLLENSSHSEAEIHDVVGYMKQSASQLDAYTQDFTARLIEIEKISLKSI